MKFFIKDNKLHLENGKISIHDLRMELEYYGGKYDFPVLRSKEWRVEEHGLFAVSEAEGKGRFTLKLEKGLLCGSFTADREIKGVMRLGISGVFPFRIGSFVYNYGDRWFPNGNLYLQEMGTPAKTTGTVKDQSVFGCQYVAFKAYGKNTDLYGVFGAVTFEENFAAVQISENGEFTLFGNLNEHRIDLDAVTLSAGEQTKTDLFCLLIKENDSDVLSAYGKKIAEFYPIKRKKLPYGWCSWYYYGQNISEEIIAKNMEEAKKRKLPVEYIQIDDGWQTNNGDWEPNEKFSQGMKAIADKIRSFGWQAGIWCAPFSFSKDSEVFRKHPEWFIKDANFGNSAQLMIDYGVKEARDYLYNLFRKFSYEWGYRYIKIDFVAPLLALNGYHEKGYTNLKNLKEAFRVMRSAVTEDTYLLACTAPLGAMASLADGLRTGYDIFEGWESLKSVARQTAKHYFISEYINVDADCLLLRTKEKHEPDCFRLCTRTKEEIKTFVKYISVTGGAVFLSDKLSLLDQEDVVLYKSLFPLNEKPAVPVDLFDREIPSVYRFEEKDGIEKYTVINWTDKKETFEIHPTKTSYAKYDSGVVSEKKADKFTIELEAHTAQTICFSKNQIIT